MKLKMNRALLLSGLLGFSSMALSMETIKPGLWKIEHKTMVNNQAVPDMSGMLANMPPALRQQIEASMKQQMAAQGVSGDGKSVQVCITPEQIASNQFGGDPEGQCRITDSKRSGNTIEMVLHCENPAGQGKSTVTLQSDSSWLSTTSMTMQVMGKSQTINSEAKGQWQAAECL
ncbi:MAG: DUF3617 domain-containing protein [Pseudomonadales bacterium]|nr:DUF3617 domain-containing protein [Pseudomonadales bacterium]